MPLLKRLESFRHDISIVRCTHTLSGVSVKSSVGRSSFHALTS